MSPAVVRSLQISIIFGLAVSLAASSAGTAMSLMCRSPSPPMWRPKAACCLPVSVMPEAMRVRVMSMVLSAVGRVG